MRRSRNLPLPAGRLDCIIFVSGIIQPRLTFIPIFQTQRSQLNYRMALEKVKWQFAMYAEIYQRPKSVQ